MVSKYNFTWNENSTISSYLHSSFSLNLHITTSFNPETDNDLCKKITY